MSNDEYHPRYSNFSFHYDDTVDARGRKYGWLGVCTSKPRRDRKGNLIYARLPKTIDLILTCDVGKCPFFIDILDMSVEDRVRHFGRGGMRC